MNQTLILQKIIKENWQSQAAIDALIDLFRKHLLKMIICYKNDSKIVPNVFTGIFCGDGDEYGWLTAGHVIDDSLEKVFKDKKYTIYWCDDYPVSGAQAFPVHNRDSLEFISLKINNTDIGYVFINGWDETNLLKNNRIIPMTLDAFKTYSGEIVGYYLLGYPAEYVESSQIDAHNYWLKAECYCIPVEKYEGDIDFDYTPNNEFVGKICDQHLTRKVKSVVGMSGGPLIGIYFANDGQLFYRLIGVQSKWYKDHRIIVAETIGSILKKMPDSRLDNLIPE